MNRFDCKGPYNVLGVPFGNGKFYVPFAPLHKQENT